MKAKNSFIAATILLLLLIAVVITATSMGNRSVIEPKKVTVSIIETEPQPRPETPPKACVFKTVFGEEKSDSFFQHKTPAKVQQTITDGLAWMSKAQNKDGGWGAGSHYSQDVRDPHAVKSDPASTAITCMALLRCGNTPITGIYTNQLNKGMEYLLVSVESSPDNALNITDQEHTQPQTKLGSNIDVVLTSQFLTNVLDHTKSKPQLEARVKKAMDKCVKMIERNQDKDGSQKGSGWAGVLQSSFANNALETARSKGAKVDDRKLEESRNYQKGNYDSKSGNAKTDKAAGVMLYAVSSSVRASAPEAKVAKEQMKKAVAEGKLKENEPVNFDNLRKAGMSESDAYKYSAAYDINESAKQTAQRQDVMTGFGNDGGEEFLSHLQTGESLIVAKDNSWKKWYDNISGKLISIQNNDGSWNGHHCITSPVFCTATCVLILSVQNDIQQLAKL